MYMSNLQVGPTTTIQKVHIFTFDFIYLFERCTQELPLEKSTTGKLKTTCPTRDTHVSTGTEIFNFFKCTSLNVSYLATKNDKNSATKQSKAVIEPKPMSLVV